MQNIFIRKRGNKHVVTLEYRDQETGKKKQKALSSHDKSQDAKRALTEEKKKLYDGDFIIPDKITFANYMLDWIEQHKVNLSPTTYERYKLLIINDVVPFFKDIELQKLTPLHLEKFYAKMLERLKGKTVMQYHRVLHKALDRAAYRLQIITKNPTDYVDPPKVQKYKAAIYDIYQVKQLIEAIKNNRLEAPVHLALSLGLRAGEILGLTWGDIDFKRNIITIRQSLIRGKNEDNKPNFKVPKSDTSLRVLTAPTGLMKVLEAYRKRQMELQLKSYGVFNNEYNLVFTCVDGRPMASDSFSRMFRDFLKKKNLPLIRFHDLRHTNASMMLAGGTNAKVASSRLGHSSISITMDLYTHVLQEMEQDAAEKLNTVIYG